MKRFDRDLTPGSALPPPRGILVAPRPDGLLEGRRLVPSARLAPFVHHYWSVRWSLRSPFTGEALPHPAAQIRWTSTSAGRCAVVQGVSSGALARTLDGDGETFGVSFRPVMFRTLLDASMASLTDREIPLGSVLGPAARAWERALVDAETPEEKVRLTEAWLAQLLRSPSGRLVSLRDLVERVAWDASLRSVDDLVGVSGLEVRALQRSFRAHVGVSPKVVLQRYRLHEAAWQLRSPRPPALASLAASLGYADQAHFSRDFRRTVGQTPRDFARGAQGRALPR